MVSVFTAERKSTLLPFSRGISSASPRATGMQLLRQGSNLALLPASIRVIKEFTQHAYWLQRRKKHLKQFNHSPFRSTCIQFVQGSGRRCVRRTIGSLGKTSPDVYVFSALAATNRVSDAAQQYSNPLIFNSTTRTSDTNARERMASGGKQCNYHSCGFSGGRRSVNVRHPGESASRDACSIHHLIRSWRSRKSQPGILPSAAHRSFHSQAVPPTCSAAAHDDGGLVSRIFKESAGLILSNTCSVAQNSACSRDISREKRLRVLRMKGYKSQRKTHRSSHQPSSQARVNVHSIRLAGRLNQGGRHRHVSHPPVQSEKTRKPGLLDRLARLWLTVGLVSVRWVPLWKASRVTHASVPSLSTSCVSRSFCTVVARFSTTIDSTPRVC